MSATQDVGDGLKYGKGVVATRESQDHDRATEPHVAVIRAHIRRPGIKLEKRH